MILFPAIDLKGGHCVRLVRGQMDRATVYNTDPAAQAMIFARAGFQWIHVVDLDGAFAGGARNGAAVDAIAQAVDLPLQLGGGIRSAKDVEACLKRGIARVILGTLAQREPQIAKQICAAFPGQVAIGIDARGGKVAVEGWATLTDDSALEVARHFQDAGAAAIVYTDIERDGVLSGPNVEATVDLAKALETPVIASGGVSSLGDLEALKAVEDAGIVGVISGRALYDGRIDPAAALSVLA